MVHWRGATLVNDCYNSNPRALDAMVDALLAMPVGRWRRIVMAGEMLELGPEGRRCIGPVASGCGCAAWIRWLACAGWRRSWLAGPGAGAIFVDTPEAAGDGSQPMCAG